MVNASLNWASIVGIVLAVCGAGLYFLRSFKPALARDYDVFFAAIGLLCGGILFFQGWRLDPILQFGQFLLAGTTVFFAYESVRLRGIATDQARRSSYFDDEQEPSFSQNTRMGSPRWDSSYDQFDESRPIRRRFSGRDSSDYESQEEDFYRPRRTSRPAIPEEAASRRVRSERDLGNQSDIKSRRMARFQADEERDNKKSDFGVRRNMRQDQRRGSRPLPNKETNMSRERTVREPSSNRNNQRVNRSSRFEGPQGSPLSSQPEDASYTPRRSNKPVRDNPPNKNQSQQRGSTRRSSESESSSRRYSNNPRPRDNSSRFDD